MCWRRNVKNLINKFIKKSTSTNALKPGILFCCGNPLLDIICEVDNDFLHKYELEENTAIMAREEHKQLFEEMLENYSVAYTAGGAEQNAMRACQWILEKPNITVFFGSVGKDEHAKILKKIALKDGVCVQYQYVEDIPTGKCAALITGNYRTLVADLGAAQYFNVNYLNEVENQKIINNAKYFYMSGFFLAVSLTAVLKIAEKAAESNECFGFNLSAGFVSQLYMKELEAVMPYVDILFGNDLEADAFAKSSDWNTNDLKEIAKKIQKSFKMNAKRSRLVIITQGPLPIILATENSICEFEVPEIKADDFRNSNGAGDCFVGGFFSQYIMNKPLDQCIRCGIYTAQHIIKQNGVDFKGKSKFI